MDVVEYSTSTKASAALATSSSVWSTSITAGSRHLLDRNAVRSCAAPGSRAVADRGAADKAHTAADARPLSMCACTSVELASSSDSVTVSWGSYSSRVVAVSGAASLNKASGGRHC